MSRTGSAAAARIFAALGDETRLRLVHRLSTEGPLALGTLTEDSGVTRQAVTKHLRALSVVGLVRDHKDGRERIFELETKRLEIARREIDRLSTQWDEALLRLKDLVESD